MKWLLDQEWCKNAGWTKVSGFKLKASIEKMDLKMEVQVQGSSCLRLVHVSAQGQWRFHRWSPGVRKLVAFLWKPKTGPLAHHGLCTTTEDSSSLQGVGTGFQG